jgi:hypothetical protein
MREANRDMPADFRLFLSGEIWYDQHDEDQRNIAGFSVLEKGMKRHDYGYL